ADRRDEQDAEGALPRPCEGGGRSFLPGGECRKEERPGAEDARGDGERAAPRRRAHPTAASKASELAASSSEPAGQGIVSAWASVNASPRSPHSRVAQRGRIGAAAAAIPAPMSCERAASSGSAASTASTA